MISFTKKIGAVGCSDHQQTKRKEGNELTEDADELIEKGIQPRSIPF